MSSIEEKIRAQRKALGMSLQEVGDQIGVTRATVQRWETGNIKNMGRDKILALSRVLHIPPEEFIGLDPGEKYLDYEILNKPQMTKQQEILFDATGDLTDSEMNAVLAMIQTLKGMRKD